MIRTERRMRICITMLVLILAFIWGNSLMPGEVSGAFSDWVKDLLASILPIEGPVTEDGGILRKIAHFTEFAALGMCLCWLVGMLHKHPGRALLCGMAAACVDETIQMFVPDRGPSIFDVGIDTCGVAVGMMLLLMGHALGKRKTFGGK